MDIEIIKIRIELMKEAIRRSRGAFIASTILSVSLIVTAWNAYMSSSRSFPLHAAPLPNDSVAQWAQVELVKQWVDSLWVTITPLGIRIGISDAAVLGALGLYIIAVWMFFCVRR